MPITDDLSKLSNVVKNDLKKTMYGKLIAKVDNIDTSDFVLKTLFRRVKIWSQKNTNV